LQQLLNKCFIAWDSDRYFNRFTLGFVSPSVSRRRTLSRYSVLVWRCLACGFRSPSGRIWNKKTRNVLQKLPKNFKTNSCTDQPQSIKNKQPFRFTK